MSLLSLSLDPADICARLLHAFQVFESWTVRIAFAIGMFLIFPGLLYVLYDCLLYVVRSLVYTGATAKAARGPDGRGRGRGSVASLSDGEDGEDDEEDEKKEKQVTAAA